MTVSNCSACTFKRIMMSVVIPVAAGIAVFLLIYGKTPLDVRNDSWIMAGYDERDIIQHYSGWTAFRDSPWSFPLGKASDMAYGEGTIISYTDSIPWVAILFKLFRRFLPVTFQYFGIYALLCYMLQAVAGFDLIYFKTRNAAFSFAAMMLFLFSPVFLERSMRHTALGSQWFILFSIILWQKHREKYKLSHYFWFMALLVLAIGIHPYFLPMIAVFLVLCVVDDLKRNKPVSLCMLAANLAAAGAGGLITGALGSGIKSSRDGFGYYSMNLNAPMNPVSRGGYTWSALLKTHAQTLGNYDGFNYFGAGIIASLFALFILFIVFRKRKLKADWYRRNSLFLILMVMCTMFAVSNVVTWGARVLFEIPLPAPVVSFCGIFRASSRLFYPVYYCALTGILCLIWWYRDRITPQCSMLILAAVLAIQLYDLHYVVIEKHNAMHANAAYVSELENDDMINAFSGSSYVLLDKYDDDIRPLAAVALKHGDKTFFSTANSGTYEITHQMADDAIKEIREKKALGPYLIATSDPLTRDYYMDFGGTACCETGGNYYLYSSTSP